MTQQEWFVVFLFLAVAAYNWFLKANASRAWFFFGLALVSSAATGESYPNWHRSVLDLGGFISFLRAFFAFTGTRKNRQLGQAARDGSLSNVARLLKRGANPNLATVVAYDAADREVLVGTPLMAAAANGHAEIVHTLIQGGARVNQTDMRGWTALICAAEEGHARVCRSLLDSGADPIRQDQTVWNGPHGRRVKGTWRYRAPVTRERCRLFCPGCDRQVSARFGEEIRSLGYRRPSHEGSAGTPVTRTLGPANAGMSRRRKERAAAHAQSVLYLAARGRTAGLKPVPCSPLRCRRTRGAKLIAPRWLKPRDWAPC